MTGVDLIEAIKRLPAIKSSNNEPSDRAENETEPEAISDDELPEDEG